MLAPFGSNLPKPPLQVQQNQGLPRFIVAFLAGRGSMAAFTVPKILKIRRQRRLHGAVQDSAASTAAATRNSRSSCIGRPQSMSPQLGTPVGSVTAQSPMRLPTRVLRSVRRFSVT